MPPHPPPSIHDDNTFVDPGDNPFRSAAEEPSSTFGLDVDTGSISVGRTFLDSGSLPPPASVRTEEWVNALGSDQPAPTDADLGVRVDGAAAPFTDDGTLLVGAGVAAREVSAEERPAAHLTFVVDTSGSMDIRERLGLVKASLALLVLNLRDDDTVAIIGQNRKLLVFPLAQLPVMTRGKGVRLQKYKDGGVSDLKVFTAAEGLTWTDSSGRTFSKQMAELTDWLGDRAQAGRQPPNGFPRNNRFSG